MRFKKIDAKFEIMGSIGGDNYKMIFNLKREMNGAFAYGDRSAHYLTIYEGDEYKGDRLWDTRYDGVPTIKEKWVNYWKGYFGCNWRGVKSVRLLEYAEQFVEIKD